MSTSNRWCRRAGLAAALWAAAAFAGEMGLDEADRLIGMGRKAREDGLYEFAEKKLGAAAEGAPDRHRSAVAQLELAKTSLAQGDAEAALATLEGGSPAEGLAAEWALTRAEALAARGDAEAALAALDEMPPEPGDAAAGRTAGLRAGLLAECGRLDEAIRACERAERLSGAGDETGGYWLALAAALWEGGERGKASAVLERLEAEGWPADVRARAEASRLAGAARWASERGDEAAAAEAREALAAFCGDGGETVPRETRRWAWERLAEAQAAAGDWAAAGASAERALELSASAAEKREARLLAARVALAGGDGGNGADGMRAVAAELQGAGEGGASAEVQAELARGMAASGDWAGAEREWRAWLAAFAGTGDGGALRSAWRGLAEALGAQGRTEEAAGAWRTALGQGGGGEENAEFYRAAGEALASAGDAAGAREALGKALEKAEAADAGAEAWPLRYRLAELALEAGDTTAGEMQLRVLSRAPEAPAELAARATMRLGALYEERGADEAAAAEYGRLAESAGGGAARAEARLALGWVHYRMGAFLEALEDFRAVAEEDPGGAPAERAEFLQAWCLYMLGKDKEALAACQAFLAAHGDSPWAPEARFWIGEQSFNKGDWAAAEEAFAGLAEAHPGSEAAPEALYWAGMAAARASEYLRANERFNALLAGWPNHPRTETALLAQGDVLAELGQFAAAILAFDEVLAKYPHGDGAMAAWGRKGDCLFTLGTDEPARYEEALLCYRALHDFADAPEDLHLQAGYKIGRCLEKTGHDGEAAEQYMETAYEYLGARESGRGDGERVVGGGAEAGVWFTRSAFAAAALLERTGRQSEALGVYRRVAESGVPAAREAAERAQRLEAGLE